ncbi:hypothetical protein BBOV_III000610 [Babesia bovis T2Bo]|uniref:Uncharacterized protein n=1 Tax=Babesia bovis TaxID=5865 RepID=A7AM44_BABBO|nr:hypothetical protein BBOV_III000610 [Babesia bovis T2Bo]EDO07628.1 hypothetical protein BBOV_III000610 [Babesia bovis T2Bo]|eukprot:XP_001611196.1 hypothetical protein [Babesia bovis T2Bo]
MSDDTSMPDEHITQWCNGNYELMHSCLQQLRVAGKQRKTGARDDATTVSTGGFWSRFWNSSRSADKNQNNSEGVRVPGYTSDSRTGDGCNTLGSSRVRETGSYPSNPSEDHITDDALNNLRKCVISGFHQYPFHRPHLVPRRRPYVGIDSLRSYVRKKYSDLERSLDQIESFSTIVNIDQYLCCELLYEGICYYGDESQSMSEFRIIEGMLHAQSGYQLKCLLSLFSFLNNDNDLYEGSISVNEVFPESYTILQQLFRKGLVRNASFLLLSATKEACRYKNMLSGDMSSVMKDFYTHTLDLINGLLTLLETCFVYFHPTKEDIRCLIMLLPHVFDVTSLLGISDYGFGLSSLFDGLSDGSSWYPDSKMMTSLCIGIREFDDITNYACNMGSRLSFIVILSLCPRIYRLSTTDGTDSPEATLLADTEFIDRFKSTKNPFNATAGSTFTLELFIMSLYCNDTERAIKCIDSGAFCEIIELLIDKTIVSERATVLRILELLLVKFLYTNNSLAKLWYDLLDFEVLCKHNSEERARLPFTGTIDDRIYRSPGRTLIELFTLLTRLDTDGNKQYAFQIWKSCTESYRSLIPNINCQVYNPRFKNELYICAESSKVDKKVADRLLLPSDGFSWWDRNSALLELVALAAGDQNFYVETYPHLLTTLLDFGLYLCDLNFEDGLGGPLVASFLNVGASRELRFPFILERLISQIGSLTKGSYDTLPRFIYERLLARDDQIETAEAALMIASSIQSPPPQQGLSVGSCLRRMYTFPLISGIAEVKIALSTLGLGGRCPFGLIETSIATFRLISRCDRIPASLSHGSSAEVHLDVNIHHNIGDGEHEFLNSVFSILSRSHIEGLELVTSSVLSSLCSNHIKDSKTATSALIRLSEILHDSKGTAQGFVPNGYRLSVEELHAYIKCVRVLFVYIPRDERYRHSGVDWLQRFVEFATWILDTHCFRNECVHWGLIEDVFNFLHEVIQGPFRDRRDTTKASQYLLEQFLQPASTISVSLVRAAWESKISSAISIVCILFKRDVLLLLCHRAAMFISTNLDGGICPSCHLPFYKDRDTTTPRDQGHMDIDTPSGPLNWWSNKIRKLNNMFSSIPSYTPRTVEDTCECLQLVVESSSLLMAHDCIVEAISTLRSKGDHCVDVISHCDFISCFGSSLSDELRMKCVYLLLQLQERIGIDSLLVANKLVKDLHVYYSLPHPSEEFSNFVVYSTMEADDLILYNKVSAVVSHFNRMDAFERKYYCMSNLSDLHRCGLDNLVLFLLNQCSLKLPHSRSDTTFAHQLLGSDRQLVSLIKLASGGGDTWHFYDWRRMDALSSLISFSKASPHVLGLIWRHWPSIEDDARKFDFTNLSYQSYVMQCQRLCYVLQLLELMATTSSGLPVSGDPSHLLKIYHRLVSTMCDMTGTLRGDLDSLLEGHFGTSEHLDIKGFVSMWRHASFQSNVCLSFDLQLGTKLFNPQSCDRLSKGMSHYAQRVNLYNLVFSSSTTLITCFLKFLSRCTGFNISSLAEKSRSWLEFASAEFNPDEKSEIRLALQIALIKALGHVWISSNVDLHGNNSVLSISIVLKLLSFILSCETSSQLRSKVYACVNLFLTNPLKFNGPSLSELVVAHLLSQSTDLNTISRTHDRTTLLQLLWSDATSNCDSEGRCPESCDYKGTLDVDTFHTEQENGFASQAPVLLGKSRSGNALSNYTFQGIRRVLVGQDYGSLEVGSFDVELRQLISMERFHSNEMFFIAIDSGLLIDYRVEALSLLHLILSALSKFDAGSIEYELGTVSYGSLGTVSTMAVSSLLQQRLLMFKRCKQCLLHSVCCPLCLQLFCGTARVLKAASGLQQFLAFWFHIQPTSADTCLVDQFLSCDLLLGFRDSDKLPIDLFHPFICTVENLLSMPSVKSRNALIKWLNRHSELIGCCMSIKQSRVLSEVDICLSSSLLRIYRVCVLWLLAEYRRGSFKSESLSNFSLILADLQCKFPLAMTMPRAVPALLDLLTSDLSTASDSCWQCILLGLQTMFPELGAFESDLDFSGQAPIKALAIEKASTVSTALVRCGTSLVSFISHLNMMEPGLRRKSLGRLALRIATVECASMLLEYILALIVTKGSLSDAPPIMLGLSSTPGAVNDAKNGCSTDMGVSSSSVLVPKLRKLVDLSKVESLLDNISRLCGMNGINLNDAYSSRRKQIFGEPVLEYLAPYDLEHVPSFGNVQQYSYSFTALYGLLLSSICNLSVVLEQYYGCRFTSPLLSRESLP